MPSDAVMKCPKCKGDRVRRGADGELRLCDRCPGAHGLVPAPAFRVPLHRARPGTHDAIERRYGVGGQRPPR